MHAHDSNFISSKSNRVENVGIFSPAEKLMKLPILKATTLSLFLAAAAAFAQGPRVLPSNTEIKVRTSSEIPAKPPANQTYTARVAEDVVDQSGNIAIPRGSTARLEAYPTEDGKDTYL